MKVTAFFHMQQDSAGYKLTLRKHYETIVMQWFGVSVPEK